MSEQQQLTPAQEINGFLLKREDAFNKVASKRIKFEQECLFARQQITKSDFAIGIARSNQDSLHNAIMNVAAVGLTLNPASSYAYLVPRDKQIVLDISYRGLCKLATDTGVIKWVQAEMYYANDSFKRQGLNLPPIHEFDDFAPIEERGEFRGVYCVAKTIDGDYLTETMNAEEVYKIREKSMAYLAGLKYKKPSVWTEYFDQMAIKSVIKRASKLWPVSSGSEQLHKAIEVLNEHEGSAPIVDYSQQNKPDDKLVDRFIGLAREKDGLGLIDLENEIDNEQTWLSLFNSAPSGKIVAVKTAVRDATREAYELRDATHLELIKAMEKNDTGAANELLDDCPMRFILPICSNELTTWVAEQQENAA